ncbi:MAG TPA: ABC-type transport auxiliary lipoprotein family protein [Steroidobacteraceae bacterium]|jgi:uncharacterized lipoprotein YmbA
MKYLSCLLALTVAACHTLPALHYYSLAAVNAPAAAKRTLTAPLIRVRHVSVPHEMDHLGLTHHIGATQLTISDNDQWTAPLNILIQGTMTRDLGERLGYEQVVAADALPVASHPASINTANLDLDFVGLAADDSCGITAQVNWALTVVNAAPRRGSVHLAATAVGGCPGGLPPALSSALGDLADQLVAQLTAP